MHNIHDIATFQVVKKGKDTGMSSTIRFKVVALLGESKKMVLHRSRSLIQAQLFVKRFVDNTRRIDIENPAVSIWSD